MGLDLPTGSRWHLATLSRRGAPGVRPPCVQVPPAPKNRHSPSGLQPLPSVAPTSSRGETGLGEETGKAEQGELFPACALSFALRLAHSLCLGSAFSACRLALSSPPPSPELPTAFQAPVCVSHAQSCPTLCDPMDCSPPGSSVHGILQVRILEQVAISFSRGSF